MTRILESLSRKNAKLLVQFITGHGNFRHHLQKLRIVESAECTYCAEEDETRDHLLGECAALTTLRLTHLGKGWISPKEFNQLDPKELLSYVIAVAQADKLSLE